MGATVGANKQTVVHKDSGGVVTAFPDVCLTKVGKPVIPIPYTNIAKTEDMDKCAETVTADGNPLAHKKSIISKSTGDEPGDKKGTSSGTITDKAEFTSWSSDVEVEGENIVHAQDLMISNNKNTAPNPLVQPPLVQTIQDETPVIPEQAKVEIIFIDPFDEPMEDVYYEVELNNEKIETRSTMSLGRLILLSEQKENKIKVTNKEFGMTSSYSNYDRIADYIVHLKDRTINLIDRIVQWL